VRVGNTDLIIRPAQARLIRLSQRTGEPQG
jgi:hypothetical protein